MLRHTLSAYAAIYENECMKRHTTFGIGGTVDMMVVPHTTDDIPLILKACAQENKRIIILGNGSNVLFPDEHLDAVVLKNQSREIAVADTMISVASGFMLTACANVAAKNGLTGLEFAYGIPGSIGGAVYMNAGAYGGEMANVVQTTTYCDYSGNVYTINGKDHDFGYRHSTFKHMKDVCILHSKLKLSYGDRESIRAAMEDLMQRRRDKQPLEYPSAGSVFKRPEGLFAGKLIEDCGLKGFRIGGAEVSAKHAGFIVNRGNASADDVKRLIDHIQKEVLDAYGVELECEIEMITAQ